jgi:hypothetical protein
VVRIRSNAELARQSYPGERCADGAVGLDETEEILFALAQAVEQRTRRLRVIANGSR